MIRSFSYIDLFAGIGGFHAMLDHAGGRCVYVSEIDAAARGTYDHNWVSGPGLSRPPQINTDITLATPEFDEVDVPNHEVLAAGFPCQPFSKSGYQRGMEETRGTLFWNIARILETRRPKIVLLENVRNLAGPRHRHEWDVIIQTLRELGYRVSSTPSVFSPHFLPPSMGGTPQVRDRVFILGTYVGRDRAMAETDVAPTVVRAPVQDWNAHDWDVDWILDDDDTIEDLQRYQLSDDEWAWINVWDDLNKRIRESTGERLPGFPLWADDWRPEDELDVVEIDALPKWKRDFLIKNARFYDAHRKTIDRWRKAHPEFETFPASRRKLEWQAQDIESLWDTVMHFRPSGIRAKAPTYLPALVAITQTSIIGSRQRRITPHEAARLQGLPREFEFANRREAQSYKQVGNGVSVGAAWHVFRTHVERDRADLPPKLVNAVLAADLNPSPDALSPAAHEAEAKLLAAQTSDLDAAG
ncbi:DNA cytosine methyltransferase [Luteipulveratus mongoliensis]|uniref:Cytosine-specific methyltransferase n=1 Tax=Luteipulveratus mongoliensis TaxID=571913 RepID=A0A0K1JED4_9MICO|nr:DNA cytosine methyltransferase [Luteipulveratus mongoliensis]AKU14950.1 DNA methyltransferase [Luteipulveratus mongoliensis]